MTLGLRREAVTWALAERDYSQRRAYRLIGINPKTWRDASRRLAGEAARMRLRTLTAERRRFGYRRLQILLDREGVAINHKNVSRGRVVGPEAWRAETGDRPALADDAAGRA